MAAQSIIVNDKKVKVALNKADAAFGDARLKKLLYNLGFFGKTKILERTALGVDVDSKLFKPYSASYKFFRQSDKGGGHPIDKVDLFFSGQMINSMTVKANSNKAVIYFAGQQQAKKAAGHHFGMNKLPERKFFSLSASDVQGIEKMVDTYIEGALQ